MALEGVAEEGVTGEGVAWRVWHGACGMAH